MSRMDAALADIVERIHATRAAGGSLRIRGGGSKCFYLPKAQGELLDTRGLGEVVDYEPSELVVTVGAGMRLQDLEALLAGQGQCLPFEPPYYPWSGAAAHATVGGMVATGLAGPARASAGGVRDYVLGLQMVNGQGQVLQFGGQVMKNVAGYDVSRLMVGALGTLGVITRVSLKVLPLPAAEATLCFAVGQAGALRQLHTWLAQPLPLNASCWVQDDTVLSAQTGGTGKELLFVRLRGAVAAVEAACHRMLRDLPGERMDTEVAKADWERCRNQQLPFFASPWDNMALWRLSLPQTAPVLDLPWSPLVEWHGALRWLWAPLQAEARIQAQVQAVRGTASVFVMPHDSTEPRPARLQPVGPTAAAQARIMQQLRASFDPHGLFNPTLR